MEQIKKYVGLEKVNYSENKTFAVLYSLFSFFFIFIPCLLHVLSDRCPISLLIIPSIFLFSALILFIWLYTTKNADSIMKHYTLQSALFLALAALFVCVPIINIYANQRTFTYSHLIAISIGLLFLLTTCIFRYIKWNRILTKKESRETNSKFVVLIGIVTFTVLILFTFYFKSLGDAVWNQIVEASTFIISFIFFSLLIISWNNIYIINKYILNK